MPRMQFVHTATSSTLDHVAFMTRRLRLRIVTGILDMVSAIEAISRSRVMSLRLEQYGPIHFVHWPAPLSPLMCNERS